MNVLCNEPTCLYIIPPLDGGLSEMLVVGLIVFVFLIILPHLRSMWG